MKKFGGDNTAGITMQEYQNFFRFVLMCTSMVHIFKTFLFFRFLQNINDVDIALTVYNIAGASIDQGAFTIFFVREFEF